MNLLIVDDHAINLKLLRAQLEVEGHTVVEAANGVEALQVIEREQVDGVISDILMPVMDGFRLCVEIRKSEKFKLLPFILYTSTYNSPEDRRLADTVGADYYLLKPAPTPAIFNALREAKAKKNRRVIDSTVGKPSEIYVLKQYNEALVHKLEEKNTELHRTIEELQVAHEEILTLNRGLELRVDQRTVELQAANRELEAFSYSVSHDLRAPLRAIDGFAAILRRDHGTSLPDDAMRLLGRVEENAKRMGALISDLLAFSRLGRKALSVQRLNLAHLVRECLKELDDEQQGRNVEITIEDLPPCTGDLILLKQVLVNLLSNALKYTRKCAIAHIVVGAETCNSEYICHVRDNGVGFDMRYAEKLFEVFQRLHAQSDFPGTGVGLAIVRRIVEKHGGRVWAEAAPNQGAAFYFSLPMENGAEEADA
jgi:signal transduction histidine kinase